MVLPEYVHLWIATQEQRDLKLLQVKIASSAATWYYGFVPMIGLGTYRGFDVEPGSDAYKLLPAVVDQLFHAGGTQIGRAHV